MKARKNSDMGYHLDVEQQRLQASPGNGDAVGQGQGTGDSLPFVKNGVNSTSVPATDNLCISVPTDNIKNHRRSKGETAFKDSRGHMGGRCRLLSRVLLLLLSVFAVGAVAATVYLAVKNYELNLKIDELAASGHGRRPCPPYWIGYQGRCYYYSGEEGNWTAGQDFCSLHNASLAVIGKEEMEFVLRYKGSVPHWIGLRRDPNQPWKWIDGNDSTLEVRGDGGDCAFLNEDGTASSSRCRTAHHWICSKPDELTSPKLV